ncbi:MAG: DsbA family protein [Alphaproteobacteria bacterium]|nr:DsbA family protein [Alphaproteobacteria bacterium]
MPRLLSAFALALLVPLAAGAQSAPPGSAFTPAQRAEIVRIVREALKADPSILRDAVDALRVEEGRRHEAATRTAISLESKDLLHDQRDAVAGNPAGSTTLVEFYDIRCPYCRHMLPVVEQVLRQDPQVRLVFKEMPVLGPASRLGARALLAAARQGAYLKLQARLMRGGAPTEDSLHADAEALGLDWARLQRDMADPAIQEKIDANLALARRLGIEGTPAFVVGSKLIAGEAEMAELQTAIARPE